MSGSCVGRLRRAGGPVVLCESDAGCLEAVDQHFKACFDQNYKMGGRRTSATLDTAGVVNCVNSRSGKSYFAFENMEPRSGE